MLQNLIYSGLATIFITSFISRFILLKTLFVSFVAINTDDWEQE